MLVLSRKQGQTVELPEVGVVIRVTGMKGSRVQLGIEAPPDVSIHRPERACKRPVEPASESLPNRSLRQIRGDLNRVETELAALMELAAPIDQPMAARIAEESIDRLQEIKRVLSQTLRRTRNEAIPISDFVKVRADVLDRLRSQQSDHESEDPAPEWSDGADKGCVREQQLAYQ